MWPYPSVPAPDPVERGRDAVELVVVQVRAGAEMHCSYSRAHAHSFVIGVDPRARTHTLAVLACTPTIQCYYLPVVNNAE